MKLSSRCWRCCHDRYRFRNRRWTRYFYVKKEKKKWKKNKKRSFKTWRKQKWCSTFFYTAYSIHCFLSRIHNMIYAYNTHGKSGHTELSKSLIFTVTRLCNNINVTATFSTTTMIGVTWAKNLIYGELCRQFVKHTFFH